MLGGPGDHCPVGQSGSAVCCRASGEGSQVGGTEVLLCTPAGIQAHSGQQPASPGPSRPMELQARGAHKLPPDLQLSANPTEDTATAKGTAEAKVGMYLGMMAAGCRMG